MICSKKEEFFGNCYFLAKVFCLIKKLIKLLMMSILKIYKYNKLNSCFIKIQNTSTKIGVYNFLCISLNKFKFNLVSKRLC